MRYPIPETNGRSGRPVASNGWRPVVLGVVAVLVLLGLSACREPSRPNVLIISMDTTRADYLGAYGRTQARTPHIDALAEEGFLFRRHLTPVPITLPSHTSLMTGHFPPSHSVHDNGTFIVPESAVTLAEVLSDAGYDTGAFIGSFPLTERFGLNQGFDVYDANFLSGNEDPTRPDRGIYFDERPAGQVVDAVLDYWRGRDAERPVFTFVHVFDPHQPQEPPAPYDLQFRTSPYDGEIAYVDEQLGRLFAALRDNGTWDNTLVVLTADHGEGLGEHGESTHAMLLHQATLHIPLILRGPGVPVGETRQWTVSTQLFQSLLDYLGIAAPEVPMARSHSLWPLIDNGGEAPPGYPRFTAFFETLAPRTSQGWAQLTGWMKDDWRLIHGPKPELFDLENDPREVDDQFAVQRELASGLFEELRAFLAANETRSVGEAMQQIDRETMERLAALGYLQGDLSSVSELSDVLQVDGLVNPKDRVVDISLLSEAKAAMSRGQWAFAERFWLQLLENSPENIDAYRGLAVIYGMLEDWERSFEYIDRALAVRPSAGEVLRLKGEILVQLGRHQEGLDILQELPFDSLSAAIWIGKAHQGLGQMEAAEDSFRRGVALDGKNRWMRLYLANQVATNGKLDEADQLYQSIISEAPYFHLAFYNYGKLLIDRGETQRARGLLERSALLAPQHQPTRVALNYLASESAADPSSAAGETTP